MLMGSPGLWDNESWGHWGVQRQEALTYGPTCLQTVLLSDEVVAVA